MEIRGTSGTNNIRAGRRNANPRIFLSLYYVSAPVDDVTDEEAK